MIPVRVRYYGPTEQRGARLRVWRPGVRARVYPREYALPVNDQVLIVAQQYMRASEEAVPAESLIVPLDRDEYLVLFTTATA